MNTRGLLDQLLKSGQEMLQNKTGGKPGASGGGQLGSLLSGAGGGALAAGAIGLLLALAQNARRVLNREQLLALTHNEGTEVFDRTIDVLIMRLRRKIELNPHQPTLIKTLRGLGYVFSADVTHSEKAA